MMHDFEKDLIKKLNSENTQRRIEKVPGSRWGRLILPAPDEIAVRPSQGMKILCIGSWTLGLLTLEALLSMEKEGPEKIRVIGLITDDIVGQSPEINVLLPDGSVSDDVRMIGEKTLVPVAPMARELILALVEKKATGEKGAIGSIDFDRIFGHEFKAKLMRPLDPSKRGKILPLPLEETRYTV